MLSLPGSSASMRVSDGSDISGLSSKQLATQQGYEGITQRNLQAMQKLMQTGAASQAEVDAAQAWAEASPPPDPAELEDRVYCEERPWP